MIASLRAPWWRRFGIPAFCFAAGLVGAVLAIGSNHREVAFRTAAVPGLLGVVSWLHLRQRRAIIRRDEVEVRGLFRVRRIRFDSLRAFTYDARSYRLYLPIPIGRIARLTLVGDRQRVVFSAGFARFDQYAPYIINLAVEATVARMRSEIDRGEKVRFGHRLVVDRSNLHVQRLLRRAFDVNLDQLRLDIADGSVFVSSGDRKLAKLALRSTPNLLALPQLVEELAVNRSSPRPDALYQALATGS